MPSSVLQSLPPNLSPPISTDLFQKVGVFFATTKPPSIHHVFTSEEPRFTTHLPWKKQPFSSKPLPKTPQKKKLRESHE
jgi:hypothetical protein